MFERGVIARGGEGGGAWCWSLLKILNEYDDELQQ